MQRDLSFLLRLSADLKNRVETAESSIESLQGEVTSLKARVKSSEGDIEDNLDDISALDSAVVENQQDIEILDMIASVNMMSINMNS